MSHELWATYSVKDHCTPRALAADIMLFDRLVFPVPQTPRIEGHEHEPGPVLWEKNPAEWERWAGEHWDPEGQGRVLGWIEPVVRKLAWSSEAAIYGEYQAEAAKLAAQKLPDYAFYATRTTLTRDLPAYVTGVAAVGPAYRSITEIERDLRIRSAGSQLPGGAVASVLAWEFFAPDPDDPKISDEKLLRETVAFVTGDAEFRKSRAAFNDWQQGFVREGANGGEPVTDLESVKRAVERMSDLLADARRAAEQLTVRKIARYAFRLAPPAINLIGYALGWPPVASIAGGAFLAVGGVTVDEKLFKAAEAGQPAPTAFVQDSQRHFGWA
jgi:hypothetical protein